jgi:hypothetical protein
MFQRTTGVILPWQLPAAYLWCRPGICVIDADKAIRVIFSYDGKLESKLDAHFQSALLYTTASGERRVRCTNTVASVSEGAMESMKFVDQDAVINIIAKEGISLHASDLMRVCHLGPSLILGVAATKMTERSLKDIRGALTENRGHPGWLSKELSDHTPVSWFYLRT